MLSQAHHPKYSAKEIGLRGLHISPELQQIRTHNNKHTVFVYGYCDGNGRGAAAECPRRWIGRGGPVAWPTRSPDLPPLDFLFRNCLKSRVYRRRRPDTRDKLLQAINDATNQLRNQLEGMQWQHAMVGYNVSHPVYGQMVHILNSSWETFNKNVLQILFLFKSIIHTERIDYSPRTWVNRFQPPAGSLRIFTSGNRAGRCRWSAGFLGDLPFPKPSHSGAAPFSPHLTLINSQDFAVKSRPNLFSSQYCDTLRCDALGRDRRRRSILTVSQNLRGENGRRHVDVHLTPVYKQDFCCLLGNALAVVLLPHVNKHLFSFSIVGYLRLSRRQNFALRTLVVDELRQTAAPF
ncbi:hypothetical protein PR048_023264 [Dryococelus australis]|uniref:Uncharacterized protein n=1 Tax=Dryococelus australis TaxID=614101 RepID=A0ABQ9GTN6_9NEOP|nr:hypothetical protein PR048_023264 [Dryococelus australis]